jgi:hypothetical protein
MAYKYGSSTLSCLSKVFGSSLDRGYGFAAKNVIANIKRTKNDIFPLKEPFDSIADLVVGHVLIL